MTGTPAGRGKKTTALAEAQRKELSGRISRNIEEEGEKGEREAFLFLNQSGKCMQVLL